MTITMARLAATCAATVALGLGGSTASAMAVPTSSFDVTSSATSASRAPVLAGVKVSANTASEGEIAAALASAGVPNPKRWAKEVLEYRPYPTNDPNLTKLRNNIAKYNPGQETTNKIVSALTP